jgi:beta-lactamase class C
MRLVKFILKLYSNDMRFVMYWMFAVAFFFFQLEALTQKEVIQQLAEKFMLEKEAPGLAIVVIQNGKSEFYNLGLADPSRRRPVTPDTIFELASVTKVFTSTACAEEILKGKMKLDEPVINYIPYFNGKEVGSFRQITLEQILTHTSSLPRVPPRKKIRNGYTHEETLAFLARWEPHYPIGSKYMYSNLGFGVAGFALSGVERRPLMDIFRDQILTPLGMYSTWIEVPPHHENLTAQGFNPNGHPVPFSRLNAWPGGGALKSTARDMEKFLSANMGLAGTKSLKAAMDFAQQPRFKVSDKLSLGLGWQNFHKDKLVILDKNGGLDGSSSYIGFIKDQGIGVVLLCNKAKTEITALGRDILETLSKQPK